MTADQSFERLHQPLNTEFHILAGCATRNLLLPESEQTEYESYIGSDSEYIAEQPLSLITLEV